MIPKFGFLPDSRHISIRPKIDVRAHRLSCHLLSTFSCFGLPALLRCRFLIGPAAKPGCTCHSCLPCTNTSSKDAHYQHPAFGGHFPFWSHLRYLCSFGYVMPIIVHYYVFSATSLLGDNKGGRIRVMDSVLDLLCYVSGLPRIQHVFSYSSSCPSPALLQDCSRPRLKQSDLDDIVNAVYCLILSMTE
jgi:hypothetical protein